MSPEDAEEYSSSIGKIGAGFVEQVAWAHRQGIIAALEMSTPEWVERYVGGYMKLSVPDRQQAAKQLTEQGMSQSEIADVLGVHQSTVSRDANASQPKSKVEPKQDISPTADANASPVAPVPGLAEAVAAAVGPERPSEPPQWSRLRMEAHEMTLLARRLAQSTDDLPPPSEAAFVGVSLTACQVAAEELLAAATAWADAVRHVQPVRTDNRLRSV